MRRLEICSGLQPCTHRRSPRWGLLRPFHAGPGGPSALPSHRWPRPAAGFARSRAAARSWPTLRPSAAVLAALRATKRSMPCIRAGRSLQARCGAAPVRSSTRPPGDLSHAEALGPVEGDVLALGERQVTPDTVGDRHGFTPPAWRNHLNPTDHDTPASRRLPRRAPSRNRDWIEQTYHRRRRQAALGRLTPIEFETIIKPAAAQAA